MRHESYIHVRVCNPRNVTRYFGRSALVDRRLAGCAMPAGLLRKIGIRPEGRERRRSREGASRWRQWADGDLRMQGRAAIVRVWFLPAGHEPRIGRSALADLGFRIDPRTGQPRRRTRGR